MSAFVDSLEDQIDYFRRQLEVWQEEARRKDHIIAALTELIPELEPASNAAPEPRESPQKPSENQGNGMRIPRMEAQTSAPGGRDSSGLSSDPRGRLTSSLG